MEMLLVIIIKNIVKSNIDNSLFQKGSRSLLIRFISKYSVFEQDYHYQQQGLN